jgi:hypothetical protein
MPGIALHIFPASGCKPCRARTSPGRSIRYTVLKADSRFHGQPGSKGGCSRARSRRCSRTAGRPMPPEVAAHRISARRSTSLVIGGSLMGSSPKILTARSRCPFLRRAVAGRGKICGKGGWSRLLDDAPRRYCPLDRESMEKLARGPSPRLRFLRRHITRNVERPSGI